MSGTVAEGELEKIKTWRMAFPTYKDPSNLTQVSGSTVAWSMIRSALPGYQSDRQSYSQVIQGDVTAISIHDTLTCITGIDQVPRTAIAGLSPFGPGRRPSCPDSRGRQVVACDGETR